MALILSRRPGEALVFRTASGEVIKATLTGIHANQVRIAVEAPKSVSVDREEIYLKKQAERES
jgi:carbon storage regulator CsrA